MIDVSYILKSIRTGQEQKAATRTWGAQKGTQLKDISAVDAHGMPVRMVARVPLRIVHRLANLWRDSISFLKAVPYAIAQRILHLQT